jgi:NADPH:quinone reductase-like Zn-dependent oxidoreductase/thioesterase domain-containing protein/NADP-dependent 3-hydroxy acid dehydrogenase YdfG/acyl carrier protein
LYRVSWRPAALESTTTIPSRWVIFCDDTGVGAELAEQARRQGGEALLVRPGETFGKLPAHNGDVPGYVIDPTNEDHYRSLLEQAIGSSSDAVIAHLWSLDLDDPSNTFEQSLAESRVLGCHSVLHLVRQLARRNTGRPPRLALITRGAQSIDNTTAEIAVAQSPLWGLGRVVAMENPELRSRLIDLDPTQDAVVAASQLWQELAAVNGEEQIAYRNDLRLVARLEAAPNALPTEESTNGGGNETSVPTGRPFRLRFNKAGSFDTLRYEAMQRGTPAEGQVELAVHAAGINFSDILKVMGLYPGITDPVVPLGIEAAGIVTAVGPGVTRFRPGDEVLGVVPFSLASHARTAEYALVPMPRNINFRQAATLPITFLTAHYALCKLAQLERGERVLIHAAAGGVGLAAIQIAQHLGAEVFATAGSDEKRDVLRRLGVKHVFSSRSLDFAEQIMEVTGREGVDVVLNSLPGEAIASSLGVLRAYGRFLEIGKTDIYQNRKIGLLPFQDNLSYFAIDLDRLLRQRPATVTSLFAEVMHLFDSGVYQPLPLTEFPARNVAGAFRYMAQRKNIGKVVVSIDAVTSSDEYACSPSQGNASSGTYLITGGLGALGLQIAQRLATNGVRHLALLSRSAPTAEIKKKLAPLVAAGVKVVTLQGDVANAASLRAALEQIPDDFPPLRGVYHAAGVLDDGVLFDMTVERFDRVLAPKIGGAWNLHTATLDLPLDAFVLFSSVACVLGSPGQGNYAAGNAFLDALAEYRRHHELPATSVNWGPWAGAGMAARSNLNESPKARSIAPIDPTQALDVLDGLVDAGPANVTVADVRWPELLRMMPGRRPSLLADMTVEDGHLAAKDQQSSLDVEFRRQLAEANLEVRQTMLRECLAGELARIMGIDAANLDLEQPLNALGLDSLMAMELKAVVESRLGFSLPMARFFENPSVVSLAADAAKLIAADGTNAQGASASSSNNGRGGDVSRGSWSPILPLETRGSLPPLFLLHPFGGDVRCYFELSRHLGTDRPIYAITARGFNSSLPPHETMDAMLADYASAIRDVCPRGPYHLAGWSTGGIYAYALADRLKRDHERVGLLAMFDTPMPSLLDATDFEDPARFMCQYVDFCNRLLGAKMQVSYEQMKTLTADEVFEVALAEARRHEMVPADASVEFLRRFVQIGQYNARIIKHYTPPAIDLPLHLFMPAQTEALAELTGKTFAADHGWGSKLGCQVTLHQTPGDHFSMLTGDDASDLAESLSECLRAADGNTASPPMPTLAAR